MILLHQPICVSCLFHGQVHPTVTEVSPFVDHLHGTSLMFRPSACQLSAVVPFWLLVLWSGTAYQMMSPPLCPCQPSGTI